jgi:hydrogenase maturation protease
LQENRAFFINNSIFYIENYLIEATIADNMAVKIFFIGNPFGSDDGIGPYLYEQLKDNKQLEGFDLMEMGVIGFDLMSYIKENDTVLIVDAVKSDSRQNTGNVVVLGEKDLKESVSLVSQHDFGIEETSAMLRRFMPNLKQISVIGINVSRLQPFSNKLSSKLLKNIEIIKEDVIQKIIALSK